MEDAAGLVEDGVEIGGGTGHQVHGGTSISEVSSVGTRVPDRFRYMRDTRDVGQEAAALLRRGRPAGLAKAPCSLAGSCLMGWLRMTRPSLEISTVSPTTRTWTDCLR